MEFVSHLRFCRRNSLLSLKLVSSHLTVMLHYWSSWCLGLYTRLTRLVYI